MGAAKPGGAEGRAPGGPAPADYPRIVNTTGRPQLIIRNRQRTIRDLYHWLLTVKLGAFAAIAAGAYLLINTIFAGLYWVDLAGLANTKSRSFSDAFFFSVQTLGTIGYGVMYPRDTYANVVMTAENFVGLTFVAVATGLIFARFSRPTARVMFTRQAIITTYDGVPTLMFRAANQRANQILEAEITVSVARQVISAEGREMRRLHDLKLIRNRTPLFALTWTILHPIDADSPLHGVDAETMAREQLEIVIVLSGVEETFAQRVHTRHSYIASDMVWDRHFAPVFSVEKNGCRVIDYQRFHDLEPVDGPTPVIP